MRSKSVGSGHQYKGASRGNKAVRIMGERNCPVRDSLVGSMNRNGNPLNTALEGTQGTENISKIKNSGGKMSLAQ